MTNSSQTTTSKMLWVIGDTKAKHAVAVVKVGTLSELAECKRRYCGSYGLLPSQVWMERKAL